MEKYRVLIKPSAAKELEAVGQKKDRLRILHRINELADNPRGPGCEKLSGQRSLYRVREGSYRIVYSVDDAQIVVVVIKIGHRKDVYRGLA